jgi:glycosyltransferase involved in cell wall biosynthesis
MKLSIYTGVRDGLYYDFHVVEMLKHHLPLADEIVVNEGYSDDGTYEAIKDLDPKIKVHRFHWDRSQPDAWHRKFKNQARELCTGDWCILLDCDEFIPEWQFDWVRKHLSETDKPIVPVEFMHFYGNYRVYIADLPNIIPNRGLRIHRNLPEIEVWGDGANVRFSGQDHTTLSFTGEAASVHHFGQVRNPARLRQKWRTQSRQHNEAKPRWDWVPGFVFNWLPHDWNDPDFFERLQVYDGPYIQAVRDNPQEFTRDDMQLIDLLAKRDRQKAEAKR